MTRLANTPSISGLIKQVKAEQLSIKRQQFVGGSSYSLHSQVTGFQTFAFTTYGRVFVTATFTADHQDYAFCELGYEVFIGGTNSNQKDNTTFFEIQRKLTTDPRKTQWVVTVANDPDRAITYYVRYYYLATDSGVLTVA